MSKSTFTTGPKESAVMPGAGEWRPTSPAIRFLDAMRAGDLEAALAELSQAVTVTAHNMSWCYRGPEEVERAISTALEQFPGLEFDSHARNVGHGLVIEDARVRDVQPEPTAETGTDHESSAAHADDVIETTTPEVDDAETVHIEVWHNGLDEPDEVRPPEVIDAESWDAFEADADNGKSVTVWQNPDTTPGNSPKGLSRWGDPIDAPPLNMPVRVTIRHDDAWVHEIDLSFPEPLLRQALGGHVDPLELSLSEVQSAFIAPVGSGFSTFDLDRPEPQTTDQLAKISPWVDPTEKVVPVPTRRRIAVPLVMATVVVAAVGGWWVLRGPQATQPDVAATPVAQTSAQPTTTPKNDKPAADQNGQATARTTRKPNVTLKSDFAFGIDSAQLSSAARQAIADVATHVRRSGLSGTIYVDGYTDDLGSNQHGKVLSQQRANAVASLLRSSLAGGKVKVVATGHGESDPIASNATESGRAQNRRVTITLPKN
jgi:outer membrane protein OmpA-like peptidoglycan-associated protein